jgi:hypothetical protein|eukprot:COSAG03_NODE_714_length_6148_cov_12.953050_6_plen_175_part_00
MDQAFLPKHYEGAPRSMYYHSMLALSPVVSGGAPFLAVPGSYQHALSLTGGLSPEQQREFEADYSTHADASGAKLYGAIAPDPYVEVLLDEGDLLIQDPMLMHSASSNAGAVPARYLLRIMYTRYLYVEFVCKDLCIYRIIIIIIIYGAGTRCSRQCSIRYPARHNTNNLVGCV